MRTSDLEVLTTVKTSIDIRDLAVLMQWSVVLIGDSGKVKESIRLKAVLKQTVELLVDSGQVKKVTSSPNAHRILKRLLWKGEF